MHKSAPLACLAWAWLLGVAAAWAQSPQEGFVTGQTLGPEDGKLGPYTGHEYHPIRTRGAILDNGRAKCHFVTWVDVHPSHAPLVLPLEGMIGFTGPAPGNWYGNGFLDIFVAGSLVGTVEPKSVRVVETGPRGRARFVWERPEGTWSVVFLVLPGQEKVFCTVRLWPKAPATTLDVRLTCYPGGQFHDGHRVVTTTNATFEQVQTADLEGAQAWWYAIYDTVYDYGPGSDGGAAVLFDPDYLGKVHLTVDSYPVMLRLSPPRGHHEVRMVLWDSFFGRSNAEIVAYMRAEADNLLRELRSVSFDDPRLLGGDEEQQRELEELLARLHDPEDYRQRAAELRDTLAGLRAKLAQHPQGLAPDDEDEFLSVMEAREKLLWDLRWRELFATEE